MGGPYLLEGSGRCWMSEEIRFYRTFTVQPLSPTTPFKVSSLVLNSVGSLGIWIGGTLSSAGVATRATFPRLQLLAPSRHATTCAEKLQLQAKKTMIRSFSARVGSKPTYALAEAKHSFRLECCSWVQVLLMVGGAVLSDTG